MENKINSSASSFAFAEAVTVRHVTNWLQTKKSDDYVKGVIAGSKENPAGIGITVASKPARQRSRELLTLAYRRAMSSDDGLPGMQQQRLGIEYALLPDGEKPITVQSLLDTTAQYCEAQEKRLASRNDYSSKWEAKETELRKEIQIEGFLLIRKVLAHLPSNTHRIQDTELLRKSIIKALDCLDQAVELPRLSKALRRCLEKLETGLWTNDFPTAMADLLDGMLALIDGKELLAGDSLALVAGRHQKQNRSLEDAPENPPPQDRATISRTNKAKRHDSDMSATTLVELRRIANEPMLSNAVRETPGIGKRSAPEAREKRKARREHAYKSMPSMALGNAEFTETDTAHRTRTHKKQTTNTEKIAHSAKDKSVDQTSDRSKHRDTGKTPGKRRVDSARHDVGRHSGRDKRVSAKAKRDKQPPDEIEAMAESIEHEKSKRLVSKKSEGPARDFPAMAKQGKVAVWGLPVMSKDDVKKFRRRAQASEPSDSPRFESKTSVRPDGLTEGMQ